MDLLDLTLSEPAHNLALDQTLLDAAERGDERRVPVFCTHNTAAPRGDGEVLRLWESARPMVVVGRSSRVAEEVNLAACAKRDIPVLRRASGGAAIVAGPGCLMYAVVLSLARRPALRAIDQAHRFVLDRLVAAIGPLVPGLACRGTSDLAIGRAPDADSVIGDRKCSGNSLRCQRQHLLYHGTLLYDFPLDLIDVCLSHPPREPGYRGGRPHAAFVANIPLPAATLRRLLAEALEADAPYGPVPMADVDQLVANRYGRADWNLAR
jgi:lipoate-protein ligase A